jgi:hypothetical protein
VKPKHIIGTVIAAWLVFSCNVWFADIVSERSCGEPISVSKPYDNIQKRKVVGKHYPATISFPNLDGKYVTVLVNEQTYNNIKQGLSAKKSDMNVCVDRVYTHPISTILMMMFICVSAVSAIGIFLLGIGMIVYNLRNRKKYDDSVKEN